MMQVSHRLGKKVLGVIYMDLQSSPYELNFKMELVVSYQVKIVLCLQWLSQRCGWKDFLFQRGELPQGSNLNEGGVNLHSKIVIDSNKLNMHVRSKVNDPIITLIPLDQTGLTPYFLLMIIKNLQANRDKTQNVTTDTCRANIIWMHHQIIQMKGIPCLGPASHIFKSGITMDPHLKIIN